DSSLARRFSRDTSVIMATIVPPAQRMLTKRPTVARLSGVLNSPVTARPTRADEPRTAVTRPKGASFEGEVSAMAGRSSLLIQRKIPDGPAQSVKRAPAGAPIGPRLRAFGPVDSARAFLLVYQK